MTETTQKIKRYIEKILFLVILFFVIFIALFFIVNLDLDSKKNLIVGKSVSAPSADANSEIKSKLGSTTFSVENYAEWAKNRGLDKTNNGLDADPDKEGLPNYLEYVYGTNPLVADTDGDKYTDRQEITNGYDPDAPGDTKPIVEISIAKMNISAPMVWSKSENEEDMLKDLENGINHYPKSASPGQNGNMVISGHSSNYIWAKGNYNHIFKNLDDLKAGDVIIVKTIQKNGRVIIYSYKVNAKFVTLAYNEKIFANTNEPTLTLSTCWPIGTNLKRLIVKAELVK